MIAEFAAGVDEEIDLLQRCNAAGRSVDSKLKSAQKKKDEEMKKKDEEMKKKDDELWFRLGLR